MDGFDGFIEIVSEVDFNDLPTEYKDNARERVKNYLQDTEDEQAREEGCVPFRVNDEWIDQYIADCVFWVERDTCTGCTYVKWHGKWW